MREMLESTARERGVKASVVAREALEAWLNPVMHRVPAVIRAAPASVVQDETRNLPPIGTTESMTPFKCPLCDFVAASPAAVCGAHGRRVKPINP